jgi:ankyrin repeat protein
VGNRSGVKAWLQLNVDVNWANPAEGYRTALHVASIRDDTKTATDLISHECNVNVKDAQGNTCLHLAVAEGNRAIVELLLQSPDIDLHVKDSAGRTAAYIAIFTGRLECAKLLVKSALQHGVDEWTEFHLSALEGDASKLSSIPKPWVAPFGVSPLHAACASGSSESVETLLAQSGEPANKTLDMFNRTPLHYAAASGHLAVVKTLLTFKADINARDQYAKTPLHFAAGLGHTGNNIIISS